MTTLLFVVSGDDDHCLIFVGEGGWAGRWVLWWLFRPILTRNSLGQWGLVAAARSLALSFLACLRCSAADVLLASQLLAPTWTAALHPHLSCAATSQESGLILNALREAFRLSLNRFFGAPRARFPSSSSPNSSFLGSRWSGIRTTCPAQRSCDCMSKV